jgi:hypothetical protein
VNGPLEKTVNKQVCKAAGQSRYQWDDNRKPQVENNTFPQAPSPTMTSFLWISDIMKWQGYTI